jgi:ferredoxin/flavodoxin---NADP+ reductase
MTAPKTNAIVSQKIEIAPGLAILRVVPDGWELPHFTPGQFAVIGLPADAPRCIGAEDEDEPPRPDRLLKRAYSIASSSLHREYMEFYVALVPSGALTPRLFALEAGSRMWLGAKASGRFALSEAPDDAHVMLVGTGTGLAPYMSMLRTHLDAGSPRKVAVLHGARHSWDLGYRSELMTLTRLCSNFHYLPVVSRPDEEDAGWTGARGHVQDLWTGGHVTDAWGFRPTAADTHVFLCGSPGMIDSMVGLLAREDFVEQTHDRPGQIHVERYW